MYRRKYRFNYNGFFLQLFEILTLTPVKQSA